MSPRCAFARIEHVRRKKSRGRFFLRIHARLGQVAAFPRGDVRAAAEHNYEQYNG